PPAVLREQQAPQARRPRTGQQLLQVGREAGREGRPLWDGERLVARFHALRLYESVRRCRREGAERHDRPDLGRAARSREESEQEGRWEARLLALCPLE